MSQRPTLTRARILRTAITLADQSGLSALSMRTLGAALEVQAMSLYHHVASRDALLDAMVDEIVGEIAVPVVEAPWAAEMRRRAGSAHAVLMAHPWACAQLMSRVNVGPNMLRYVDATIGCLVHGGFTLTQADRAWNALDSYIYGFTLHKLNFPFAPEDYAQVAAGYLPSLSAATYPWMHAMTVAVATRQHDGLHDLSFGLELLIEGLGRVKSAPCR